MLKMSLLNINLKLRQLNLFDISFHTLIKNGSHLMKNTICVHDYDLPNL